MKFAAIVLFLGCSAVACKYAVQSPLCHLEPPTLAVFPEIRGTLERLRFVIPQFRSAPAATTAVPAVKPEALPLLPMLSKAETLLLIAAAAEKHNVSAAFVQSIVAAESNFNSAAVSPKGAIGLMQLMPSTAEEYGADPAVPAENIDAGTRYLRWLMNRYQKDRRSVHATMKRVIAAYNAGPGTVDRYRGVPPFRETRTYVTRVLNFLKQFEGAQKRSGFKG
jgi:soluble lytic murein transglycosylase-like protein